MAVNDCKVCDILRDKLALASRAGGHRARLREAWTLVLAERQDAARSTDEDLAAADHYLQNRWLVSFSAVPGAILMSGLTNLYAVVKAGMQAADQRLFEENQNRASPTSLAQHAWGMAGVRDGLKDCVRQHPLNVFADNEPVLPGVCQVPGVAR